MTTYDVSDTTLISNYHTDMFNSVMIVKIKTFFKNV